jgi:riboflavin synthase
MFTGIIESLGIIKSITQDGGNLHFSISSSLTPELKIDQSIAHNGICLTVIRIDGDTYTVTAIEETIQKTNIAQWEVDQKVNLERAMKLGDRLDGHLVQGHVDQTGVCQSVEEKNGSWFFTFGYETEKGNITIEKGSITVNGVSLTVVNSNIGIFSVAIIPYTYEYTNFNQIQPGEKVNLEFDVIGKYLSRLSESYFQQKTP